MKVAELKIKSDACEYFKTFKKFLIRYSRIESDFISSGVSKFMCNIEYVSYFISAEDRNFKSKAIVLI